MELTLTTPALLFPAIALLLLAYTNRFLALASLIRSLKSQYKENRNPKLIKQIDNIRRRIFQVRNMQACGILGFLICVLSMWLMYNNQVKAGEWAFGLSLVLLMLSLLISFREIQISVKALEIDLEDLEELIRSDEKQ